MANQTKAQVSQSIVGAGLTPEASKILINNITAKTIAGAQGTNPADFNTDFVTLYCLLSDESGSMSPYRQVFVQEVNNDVEALKKSAAGDTIAMSHWAFNSDNGSRLVHSYLPLDLIPSFAGYNPDGQTPLFDAVMDAITSMLAYEDVLVKAGTRTQTVFVALTDGGDNDSHRATAAAIKTVVDDLLTKEKYLFSLIGFGTNGYAQQIAKSMGFLDSNVLEVGGSEHDLRIAMGTKSKSVIRASQTVIGGKSQSGFFVT